MTRDELKRHIDGHTSYSAANFGDQFFRLAEEAGYTLVPVEPTEAMIDAGASCSYRSVRAIYKAMVAAAIEAGE